MTAGLESQSDAAGAAALLCCTAAEAFPFGSRNAEKYALAMARQPEVSSASPKRCKIFRVTPFQHSSLSAITGRQRAGCAPPAQTCMSNSAAFRRARPGSLTIDATAAQSRVVAAQSEAPTDGLAQGKSHGRDGGSASATTPLALAASPFPSVPASGSLPSVATTPKSGASPSLSSFQRQVMVWCFHCPAFRLHLVRLL
jgi:hypothetical protein